MLPAIRSRGISRLWDDPLRTMESQFGDTMRRMWENGGFAEGGMATYPVDIHEDDNNIYVEAELPGFNKDEIQVDVESGILTISGERTHEARAGKQHLSERSYTQVQRSFNLPSNIEESNVEASLKDGVLHVTLPKREESKPHRISVK